MGARLMEDACTDENMTLQDENEKAEPSTQAVTQTVLSRKVANDTIVLKAIINEMLSKVRDGVVLVDIIINTAYLGESGSQAIAQERLYIFTHSFSGHHISGR